MTTRWRHLVVAASVCAVAWSASARSVRAQTVELHQIKIDSGAIGFSVFQEEKTTGDAWAGMMFLQPGQKSTKAGSVVALVEPGSPAQLAGIVAGDTVLSFNEVPIATVIKHPKRFKPGERVTVQYRRGGLKESAMTLARRPVMWMRAHVVGTPMLAVQGLSDGPIPGISIMIEGSPGMPVAGAALAALNADLAEALRVSVNGGLLVLSVAPGTPAKSAGLRGGDVLVSADSVPLEEPVALAKVMGRTSGKTVTLIVNRGGKVRTVPLKW